MSRKIEIFCPQCTWKPVPSDRWLCSPCGHSWNTFDTGGVCPRCGKAWANTACLVCHSYPPHQDWYHDTITEEITEEKKEQNPIGF